MYCIFFGSNIILKLLQPSGRDYEHGHTICEWIFELLLLVQGFKFFSEFLELASAHLGCVVICFEVDDLP